jgi:hypothetical protein
MILRAATFFVVLLALGPLLSLAQPAGVTANEPIINFKLPVLNEEGNRSSLLRGDEARYISASQIDLVAMQYTLFDETVANKVDTTLLAPSATVFFANKRYKVQGIEGVRIVRDDLDVGGTNWTFEIDEKKDRHIVIENKVRVVFRTLHLGNILK